MPGVMLAIALWRRTSANEEISAVIGFAVFAAVCCLTGAAIVFFYERRQNVLHGRCIERKPWHP
jgi:hypothetical protein